mgnify:CR=1 FL=1
MPIIPLLGILNVMPMLPFGKHRTAGATAQYVKKPVLTVRPEGLE